MGALTGVKVLDLTRLLPGPYCTLIIEDKAHRESGRNVRNSVYRGQYSS
jgi:hypothetical protein